MERFLFTNAAIAASLLTVLALCQADKKASPAASYFGLVL
jgi:hypothetical protein